ncbi:MAG: winged helix-turn-helix domain-containing protein [Anaerolineales bacterium]|nr:winged helix-turn-helix domain-containing protein [Anaerolineales bacterium]
MSFSLQNWPFAPAEARTPDENLRWWAECHVPDPAQAVLFSQVHWCALIGPPQSGKTVALAAWRAAWARRAFILEYPLGGAALQGGGQDNHLYRIMTLASRAVRETLVAHPEGLELLSQTQREFLRWLVEKFDGPRAYPRWLDGLPRDLAADLAGIAYEDLYPTQVEVLDVQGQIEELVNLCRRFGYQQLAVLVDTGPVLTAVEADLVRDLFGWLELIQHGGFRVLVALPAVYTRQELLEMARGRIGVVGLSPSYEHCQQVVNRHLACATNGTIDRLEQLASSDLVDRLRQLVEAEYGAPVPGAWVRLAGLLLERTGRPAGPLPAAAYAELCLQFYARHLPLRLEADDRQRGVWRGHRWLALEEAPFEFLKELWAHQGSPVDQTRLHWSKEYLHTLAHRLRVAIEPDPAQPVYVRSHRGEGYWLENTLRDPGGVRFLTG